MFKLFGSEFGKLQRHRGVAQEPAGNCIAPLGDLITLKIEYPAREVAVRRVPERVDAEHLYVDAVLVHVRDARGVNREAEVAVELSARRPFKLSAFEEIEHGRYGAVRVHVHGRDPAAADCDLAALRNGCRL